MKFASTSLRESLGRKPTDDEVLWELELEERLDRVSGRQRAYQQRADRTQEERAKEALHRLKRPRRDW